MRNRGILMQGAVLLTVIVVSYLGFKAVEMNRVVYALGVQIEDAQNKLQEEETILADLKIEREEMDTVEYIEKVAREKLGMVKPDDIVFREK